jgi:hypothetical protein
MTNTPESDTMNKHKEFKRQILTQTIQANRDGWRGVWDAIVATATKNPRLTVAREITVSIYATEPVKITCVQAEIRSKQ